MVADTPAALASKLGPIDAAAKKLSDASYPFMKSVAWDSDLYLKPLPGVSPNAAMKAIDKMIVMGATMDGKLLREAAMAHHNALNSMDSKLVTDADSYQKVNAALGKVIASVPSSQVMDVFNSVGKITSSSVPNMLFSMSAPNEAVAAYDALMQFKDVVKAAQRCVMLARVGFCTSAPFFRRTVVGCPSVWFDVQRQPRMYRHIKQHQQKRQIGLGIMSISVS